MHQIFGEGRFFREPALFVSSRRFAALPLRHTVVMKKLLECLVSLLLHPIAMFLMVVNLLGRSDLSGGQKVIWTLACLLWGVGPILYVTVGDGDLW